MTMQSDAIAVAEHQRTVSEALANCAREPIHLIGSIQPVGVLLAVDVEQLLIHAASANLDTIFPLGAAEAIGKSLLELIGAEQMAWLEELRRQPDLVEPKLWSLVLERAGQLLHYDAQVFRSEGSFVIEVEQWQAPSGDVFHELFIPLRDALCRLDQETDLEQYARETVSQVRTLSGFDRVMMYRFDTNWDGEVIAESKIENAASYLGNRFPASDIPAQARALYTTNLVRLIADVDATPVPLLRPAYAAPIDLSHSWLRNLSPMHVQYLRNMGVRASLSISLVQNGRLWGLIACHHFTPKYVGLRERGLDEFIGRSVSLKLNSLDKDERDALSVRIRNLLHELTTLIRCSDDLDHVIHLLKNQLLGLVRAAGAIIVMDGMRHMLGDTPPSEVVLRLFTALHERPLAPVFHTDDLRQLIGADGTAVAESGGGVMVAPLGPGGDNYVMWFRPGILRTLHWAGAPNKEVEYGAGGVHISPRRSFDTWVETYHDKSLAWSQVEIDAAGALSHAMIEVLAQKALKTSEESYRLLADNSTDMIARLGPDGCFRFASPACRELLGLDSEQIVGHALAEVLDPGADGVALMLAAIPGAGDAVTKVLRGTRPDGRPLWIEATLRHMHGGLERNEIVLNARDVTQRHIYQLAIEEVHRRQALILEAAGEGLVSLDGRGYIAYANEQATRILAREEHDLLGMHCCDIFCATSESEGSCSSGCPFLATVRDGAIRQGRQCLSETAGRTDVWVEYVCTPLLEGHSLAGCVIVLSVSEAPALPTHSVATEVILDQAIEAVMVTDRNKRITSVNRAFTEITGFSAVEAIGKTPAILKSGVHTHHFYEELWCQLKEKRRWAGEIWNHRKNGEIYPQWGSISAIGDVGGEVQSYVAVFSDISKVKQAEERLQHLANHDTLTGLPNRMSFTDSLARMLERSKRTGTGVAVVFIDLDRFKIINDTLGHAIGDSYLTMVTERLLSATRKVDMLARWGGDEFVLAMEDVIDRNAIGEMLGRMLKQLAQPIYLAGHELIPTASIGVSLFPGDGLDGADLIKAADTAMYRAKEKRNCFEFYAEAMSDGFDAKLVLTSELRHALMLEQFFLVYQPQIDPRDSTIHGVEALVRWRHPVRGVQPPSTFLPLMEELGLLEELGNWVLTAACRQMRLWSEQNVPIPRVAVNVAPCQIKESFIKRIAYVIETSEISPQQLEIEITEGALKSDELAGHIMHGLRALGVWLSIDDFGTGYSSLSHLKTFPITCFKIDKSFIDGIPANENDVAIVRTILALGNIFKVEVVAEGVETVEQMEFLRAEGVSNIQGFYFARPMTPAQIDTWVSARLIPPPNDRV